MDFRDKAVALARRGFRVFPCQIGEKTPRTKRFYEAATSDPDSVAAMWTSNTGAALRFNIGVSTDDLIVVDIDTKNGKNGWVFAEELGLSYDTFTVATPSGGTHLYYRDPDGQAVRNKAGLGVGVDIRGFHGYVVGPGSVLENGEYRVVEDKPVAPAGAGLYPRLARPIAKTNQDEIGDRDTPARIAQAVCALQSARLTGEQDAWRLCAHVRNIGISPRTLFDLIYEHVVPNHPQFPNEEWWWEERIEHAEAHAKNAPGSEDFTVTGVYVPPEDPPAGFGGWHWFGEPSRERKAWLFYRVLPASGSAMLFAPSGAGKTFLDLELARCLATGEKLFGVPPDDLGGTAFVFGGSEQATFHDRQAALQVAKGLPIVDMHVPPLNTVAAIDELVKRLETAGAEMQSRFGVPLRLVIFETFMALQFCDDLNDGLKVSAAIGGMAAIGRRLGATVLFTHHPTKQRDTYHGSQAFEGATDTVIEIEHEPGRAKRVVKLRKARGAPQKTIGTFTLRDVVVGVDDKGRPETSCTLSMSHGFSDPVLATSGAADEMVNKLRAVSADGQIAVTEDDLYAVMGYTRKTAKEFFAKTLREALDARIILESVDAAGAVTLVPNAPAEEVTL